MSERIRVLVVDDSALMRKLIPAILERDSSIEVVGTAMDGAFALRKIEELEPDVVTLDLEMPRMDGLEMLRLIMRSAPLPVILFSTHSKEGGYAARRRGFSCQAKGRCRGPSRGNRRPAHRENQSG